MQTQILRFLQDNGKCGSIALTAKVVARGAVQE